MNDQSAISRFPRHALALMLACGALALAACDKGANESAGQKLDSAVSKTESAATTTGEKLKDAGATMAAAADDASITAAVSAGLARDPDLSAIKIDVDTKGGTVSLTGPAPTAAAKARAEEIAKGVSGVVAVNNKLDVKM